MRATFFTTFYVSWYVLVFPELRRSGLEYSSEKIGLHFGLIPYKEGMNIKME
jgi:hypothetical protein